MIARHKYESKDPTSNSLAAKVKVDSRNSWGQAILGKEYQEKVLIKSIYLSVKLSN